MVELAIWIGVFIISLAVLIKASDYFTISAERIGVYFGLPAFIVGVLIVSIGTSLPELVSSIIAVFAGSTEIVAGNVVGSNIANILLILGITVIIAKKLVTKHDVIFVDLPLLIGSAFLLALTIWDGKFTLPEALIMLVGLAVYLHYALSIKKDDKVLSKKERQDGGWRSWMVLILSGGLIYIGAKYTVDSIIQISAIANIGVEIIAVSAVALGTSLPELSVSIVAAKRGKSEIALGNILGSSIFNSFAVMGIPGLFGTLIVPQSIVMFAMPIMVIATLLFFFMIQEKEITHWEGWLLLLFYVFFIGKLFSFF